MLQMTGSDHGLLSEKDAAAARQALYKKYALLNSTVSLSRSERFSLRLQNKSFGNNFNSFAALPLWSLELGENNITLAYVAGLVYFRKQLDRELDGSVLRSLASKIGEDLIDSVMDMVILPNEYLASDDLPLPLPDEIFQTGHRFINLAITGNNSDNDVAKIICNRAYDILRSLSPETIGEFG